MDKRWTLIFESLRRFGTEEETVHGLCDPPGKPNKCIRIEKSLTGKDRMETLVHEMLHAMLWPLDEDVVRQMAHDLTEVLWQLGYRSLDEL